MSDQGEKTSTKHVKYHHYGQSVVKNANGTYSERIMLVRVIIF